MTAPRFAKLIEQDEKRVISRETDEEFYLLLQRACLFALREQGRLSESQYARALEILEWTRRG